MENRFNDRFFPREVEKQGDDSINSANLGNPKKTRFCENLMGNCSGALLQEKLIEVAEAGLTLRVESILRGGDGFQ
jgi:hypothetical protein